MDKSQAKSPCFLCGATEFSWGFVTSYIKEPTRFVTENNQRLGQKLMGRGGDETCARRCDNCGNILLFDAAFVYEN